MDSKEKNNLLTEGEIKLPSNIGVIPARQGFKFTNCIIVELN